MRVRCSVITVMSLNSPHLLNKQKSSSAQVSEAVSLLVDARTLLLGAHQRLASSQSSSDTKERIDKAVKAIDVTRIHLDSTQL